jgi:ABC-type bacteriocin/lantibiotic exporter with double-glycine peptidase domain
VTRGLALLFAIVGTLLLASISFLMTTQQPWLVLIATLVTILFIGYGFVVKVRMRRKNVEKPTGSNS